MNRVICDVCGTKYPESADLCPICGCAKPENAKIVPGESSGETKPSGNYTYVKGGRFSKSNVRKRNKAVAAARENEKPNAANRSAKNKDSSKGLVVAVITLLLAIISVMLFIFFEYFMPSGGGDSTKDTGANVQTTTSSNQNTTESTAETYPCTAITLSATSITFDKVGKSQLLSIEVSPANTTDVLTFTSSNPDVASVDANGLITAVADGNVVITVTCGSVTETCAVTVSVSSSDATTDATEPQPEFMLYINGVSVDEMRWGADVTLKVGESFRLTLRTRNGEIIEMSWSASKQDICSISGNEITAKAKGITEIRAKHDGVTYKCTLRVN